MSLHILYEDNHLIAVEKKSGVLVQADKTGDPTLLDEVKYYLKTTYHKTGKVFLGLIHRLDRPVSGIILFAKTSKGAARLSEQFRSHQVQKMYHALVEGIFSPTTGSLKHFLRKDSVKNVTKVFTASAPDTQYAELEYTVLQSSKFYTLLSLQLKTGRSHQIRAQLAFVGHPVVGDVKYGSHTSSPDHGIALQSSEMIFQTATTSTMIHLTLPAPQSWLDFLRGKNQ